jgi:hypothetical protein
VPQAVLQMVTTEVQSLSTKEYSPHQQIRVMATGLVALNLASITGVSNQTRHAIVFADPVQRKSRISQAEKLYNELISVCHPVWLVLSETNSSGCAKPQSILGQREPTARAVSRRNARH